MFLDISKPDSISKEWFPAYVILINSWRDNIMFVVLQPFEQLRMLCCYPGQGYDSDLILLTKNHVIKKTKKKGVEK